MEASRVSYPTADQIFNKRSMSTCAVEIPDAWCDDSIATRLADEECARLLINEGLYDAPVLDAEIQAYAREYNSKTRKARLEHKRNRNVWWQWIRHDHRSGTGGAVEGREGPQVCRRGDGEETREGREEIRTAMGRPAGDTGRLAAC